MTLQFKHELKNRRCSEHKYTSECIKCQENFCHTNPMEITVCLSCYNKIGIIADKDILANIKCSWLVNRTKEYVLRYNMEILEVFDKAPDVVTLYSDIGRNEEHEFHQLVCDTDHDNPNEPESHYESNVILGTNSLEKIVNRKKGIKHEN